MGIIAGIAILTICAAITLNIFCKPLQLPECFVISFIVVGMGGIVIFVSYVIPAL